MPGPSAKPIEDRLWPKVREAADGCWIWLGSRGDRGYGQINSGGHNGVSLLAHRVAYELVVGLVPVGLVLDHLCRNPSCVNPAHLEPVRQRTNLLRGEGKSIAAYHAGTCTRGHPRNAIDTYISPTGLRVCRICRRTRDRATGGFQR